MTDTEICRLCAEALSMKTEYAGGVLYAQRDIEPKPDWFDFDPFTNAKQAAAVRWKLLELGVEIIQSIDTLDTGWPNAHEAFVHECRAVSDEYRLLAETLARHQREAKNGYITVAEIRCERERWKVRGYPSMVELC